jgi:tetratricopeptide (TPR) repeat protein/DNA-binding CsgD family transcriptional regulator
MVKKIHFIILLISALSFSQKKGYDFKAAEAESRRLIYTAPDSALTIIKRTLAQKGDVHDTIYGNTYSLYGMYYGMTGKPDSTIYYLKKSLTYLDKYPKNRVRSLMNLAIGYRNKGEYKTSIKQLLDAIELNKNEKNNVGVAMAYGELASNYNYMLEYDKSVDYLLKAIAILKAEKNTKHLTAVKQKLANTYLAKQNYKFAIDLYRECLAEFKAAGISKNYYLTLVNLGDALIQVKDLAGSKQALQEAVIGLEKFGDKEMLGICYSKIADLDTKQGQPAKAIASYEKAINVLKKTNSSRIIRISGEYINLLNRQNKHDDALKVIAAIEPLKRFKSANIQDQMVYKNAMADTYKATNNDKEAIKAYQNTIAIMDSIAVAEKKSAVEEIQAKFQTELQREKNQALEANNMALQKAVDTEKMLRLLYIIVSIAIIVLILLFLRGYWLKNRLQKEELKSVESEKNLIQQHHLHEQELTNAQREIIEEKQRELTSTALRMANYQDSISEIIEKCEDSAFTKVNDVKKELQHLMKQKDYWKQFETRFNSLHPEFGNTLISRYSRLTKNDVEFCSLLKLNLSNKEIASLLQISHESAITKKYRIKKKMEINDDDEFEKILMAI